MAEGAGLVALWGVLPEWGYGDGYGSSNGWGDGYGEGEGDGNGIEREE